MINVRGIIAAGTLALALGLPAVASAHNRAHLDLPTGNCIIVGSEKSVAIPPSASAPVNFEGFRDLRPEDDPDQIGTAFAANQGNSAIQLGACP